MDYDFQDKMLFFACVVGLAVVLADVFIWRF